MTNLDADLFRRLVDSSPEAIALVDGRDPEMPVRYVNASFLALTGYAPEDLLGRNLRLLQGQDRDQDGRRLMREMLARGEGCSLRMRNYRKDGSPFLNDMTIVPLRDAEGAISHYVGFHRDASDKARVDSKPPAPMLRDDRLTGLYTLAYMEELLKRDWAIAQRERRSIAVFAIDIDSLDLYNSTFGRAAGDSGIRRVAHCISGCLRRASDAAARTEGGRFVAFAPGLEIEHAFLLGQTMTERVRDLRIHHPRSSVLRYLSISVGVAASVPGPDPHGSLIQRAEAQLQIAKTSGRNRAA